MRPFSHVAAAAIVLAAILLFGCSSVKKTTTTQTKTVVDSSSVSRSQSHRDTISSSNYLQANDISFSVVYSDTLGRLNTDSFLLHSHQVTHSNTSDPTSSILSFLPMHSKIVSISGHIGSLTDSSTIQRSTADTLSLVVQKKQVVADTIKKKESGETGVASIASEIPWYAWLLLIIGLFIVLLIIFRKIL